MSDGITTPNGGAYEKTETRTGPPLDYVASKMRMAIEAAHHALEMAMKYVPEIPAPTYAPPDVSVRGDLIISPIASAFRSAVVSYLALNNLLAVANNRDAITALMNASRDELKQWLDGIDREGSVT